MDIDNSNNDVFKVKIGDTEHTITPELNGCPTILLTIESKVEPLVQGDPVDYNTPIKRNF